MSWDSFGIQAQAMYAGGDASRWQTHAQRWQALGATHFVGMHWGTFDLTDEPLDHGAFTLLPRIARDEGIAMERFHVLAHGGVLGFGERVAAEGRATAEPATV